MADAPKLPAKLWALAHIIPPAMHIEKTAVFLIFINNRLLPHMVVPSLAFTIFSQKNATIFCGAWVNPFDAD
jgi:hypothetical protein